MTDEVMESEECAALLRCTVDKVEELARAGELPALQIGRKWIFIRADLLVFLADKARAEAEERRARRQPTSISDMVTKVRPRRQVPPVLPVVPKR